MSKWTCKDSHRLPCTDEHACGGAFCWRAQGIERMIPKKPLFDYTGGWITFDLTEGKIHRFADRTVIMFPKQWTALPPEQKMTLDGKPITVRGYRVTAWDEYELPIEPLPLKRPSLWKRLVSRK